MSLNDVFIALIRKVVASAAGGGIAWLIAVLHIGGVDSQTSGTVIAFIVVVAIAAYGWVAQQLEQLYPTLGRILFLGASRQVTYARHPVKAKARYVGR